MGFLHQPGLHPNRQHITRHRHFLLIERLDLSRNLISARRWQRLGIRIVKFWRGERERGQTIETDRLIFYGGGADDRQAAYTEAKA